jgi:hypothetical protein
MSADRCPICGGSDDRPILEASGQPLLLNHLLPSRAEALAAPRCELAFRGCVACGFVRNAAFRPESVIYGPGYVNDQAGSAVFRAHLDQVMRHLGDLIDGVPGRIVEVGCGQGGFLAALCRATGRAGIGFDPALARSGEIAPRVTVRAECFESDSLGDGTEPTALIYCRHVLEHLADPKRMIRVMGDALGAAPRAALYVEVPTFEWIDQHGAFFDLFNEHCSLFGTTSMRRALLDAELSSIDVRTAFGGQYLAATARGARAPTRSAPSAGATPDWKAARERLESERTRWRERLAAFMAAGPTYIWGAAAKGVSIVNQLGLTHRSIPCLVDINPGKQGTFVPGTGQEVIAPETLAERLRGVSDATVLVMNPNYEREVEQQLATLGCSARIEVARFQAIRGSTSLEVQR